MCLFFPFAVVAYLRFIDFLISTFQIPILLLFLLCLLLLLIISFFIFFYLIVNLSHSDPLFISFSVPPFVILSFSLLQESISDFYWYYSGKDVIDEQGQRNFSKAINVAKQVFNTLTEYIQVVITAEVILCRAHTSARIHCALPWVMSSKLLLSKIDMIDPLMI